MINRIVGLKYQLIGVGVGLLLLVAAYLYVQNLHYQIKTKTTEITFLKRDLETERARAEKFRQDVSNQNQRIKQLEKNRRLNSQLSWDFIERINGLSEPTGLEPYNQLDQTNGNQKTNIEGFIYRFNVLNGDVNRMLQQSSNKVAFEPAVVERYKPERPAPIKLVDEKFITCPNEDPDQYICIAPGDAKQILINKTRILSWVRDATAVINYYESEENSDPSTDK